MGIIIKNKLNIKKYLAKYLAFILIPIISFLLMGNSFSSKYKPTPEFYVNDYDNVINYQDKEFIINNSKNLFDKTTAQIVVSTINSLDNYSIEDFSIKMAESFGIGNKQKNNGILILLETSGRKIRVDVGYGLEGALPDSKVGRLIDDYFISTFKDTNNYSLSICELYKSILNEVYKEYNLEYDPSYISKYNKQDISFDSFFKVFGIFLILLLIFIVNSIFSNNGTPRSPTYFGGFGGFYGFRGNRFGGGFSSGNSNFGAGGSFGGGGASRQF